MLYHYTSAEGMAGILASQQIMPSLKAINPKDARYGDGQYLSDIAPGAMTNNQLSREFLNVPWAGRRFSHYVCIETSDLNVVQGREHVFVVPNSKPLSVAGRIEGSGKNQ
ncbi:HYD1 signature containing ADP-ribosyltransferase family protein [Methylobacterium platani]|uniref:HYD1 signature containing ADP-ribosyltransferase family protein n=1 Tax=Methylobacterium platani TaxID=427683 RepID=UPI003CC90AFE